MKDINKSVGKEAVKVILEMIGEDTQRAGLIGTPERVVNMWKEIFRGYNSQQRPKITTFDNGEDGLVYDEMILDTGDFYSHCEHHMVPFFGTYYFGYIPSSKGKILGLSKVARLVDYHSAKLQIQERLTHEIVEDLWEALQDKKNPPLGMGIVIKGQHLCKTMRGAKKKGEMTTIKLRGVFKDNDNVKKEFLSFIK